MTLGREIWLFLGERDYAKTIIAEIRWEDARVLGAIRRSKGPRGNIVTLYYVIKRYTPMEMTLEISATVQ